MRQSIRLIQNAVVMWASRLAGIVPQLIMMPFLLNQIGPEKYGIFSLAWSLRHVLNWAQDSMSSAVVKYSSSYLAEEKIEEVNQVFSTTIFYFFAVGVIGFLAFAIYAFSAPLEEMLNGAENAAEARFAILTFGVMIFGVMLLNPYQGLIMALQRHDLMSIVRVILQYARLGLVIAWFLIFGASVKALVVITAVVTLMSPLSMRVIAHRKIPGLHFSFRLASWSTFLKLFTFGGVLALTMVFIVIRQTGMNWVAGVMISLSFVTYMAIIVTPANIFATIIHGMTLTIMPAASMFEANKDYSRLKELLLRGTRYSSILSAGAIVAAAFLVEPFLSIWLGEEYLFLGPYTVIVFSAQALMMTTSPAHHLIRGMGLLKYALISSGIGEAILPMLIFVLSFLFLKNGYIALTLGLSIGSIVYAVLRLWMCGHALRIDFIGLIKHAYLPPFAIIAVIGGVSGTLIHIYDISNLFIRVGITTVDLALASVVFIAFFASDSEIRLAKEIFGGMKRKFARQ